MQIVNSVAQMCPTNELHDGEHAMDDGWIYKENKRLRKWFTYQIGWNHFWHPTLEQIGRIEALYQKALLRLKSTEKKIEKVLKLIVGPKPKDKNYYAIFFTGDEYCCWRVFIEKDTKKLTYAREENNMSFLLGKQKRKKLELGILLLNLQKSKTTWATKLSKLLHMAIYLKIRQKFPKYTDRSIFEIRINNRKYIYQKTKTNDWYYDQIQTLLNGQCEILEFEYKKP